jgi:hypothetical protein
LEELWDALDLTASDESGDGRSDNLSADDSICALQLPETDKAKHKHTLKLLARIGKYQVPVLVDSGSVGTFVSDKLVQTMRLHTEPCQSTSFKAADGGQLHCSEKVPKLQWCVQGQQFTSDARVLTLRCYDMILGEDWLEAVSPIWVDYKTKAMRITLNGKRVSPRHTGEWRSMSGYWLQEVE